MKRIWARESFIVDVTDSEWETLREKYGKEQEISTEDVQKIVDRGEISGDSYIPQDVFDCPELMGLKA